MKHLDLFSGIGGFALAARWMEWQTVQFVEIDSFCQKVLTKNFPNIPIHGDIKTFDGSKYRGTVDILTGGFPCQPYSIAGKRKGTDDERHLWPEMLRVIGEVQPTVIVGENVGGLLNWSRGMVFEQVQIELENKGYQVQSFILPACGKDAGHKRERVWITAHIDSDRFNRELQGINATHWQFTTFCDTNPTSTTNINGIGVQGKLQKEVPGERRIEGRQTQQQFTDAFQQSDSFEPKLCRTLHGIPFGVDRIKSLGNSVVPQVVFEIFKAIQSVHETTKQAH